MRRLFLALAFAGFCSAAQAQSTCPAIVYGAILTPGQWNQCFSNKQDTLGYTPVNRAGDAMTGRLVTNASTTSRAGFAISPGIAPIAPVDGDLWTTTGGVFARVNGSTVGPFSATGSTVPSVIQGDLLYGSGASTISTLPKNTSATRYLSNAGTSNNPAWSQVDLATGVTGILPYTNLVAGTQDNVLGYFSSTTVSGAAVPNCATAVTYNTTTHAFGCNSGTGSGTVTSAGLTNTYGLSVSGSPITTAGSVSAGVSLLTLTNSLGADVLLNNITTYFPGPSIVQGTVGTWWVSGRVTLIDTAGGAGFFCKLWDGTTIISSGWISSSAASFATGMNLSGFLTSPAGNITISCRDTASTSGKILFNGTGNSKDSTLSGVRVQ